MNTLPTTFFSSTLATPAGPMLAIASDQALFLLEFSNRPTLLKQLSLFKQPHIIINKSSNPIIKRLKEELECYFTGTLTTFTTPIQLEGTPFQKKAWQALQKIPYGQTRSYSAQAHMLGQPKAFRAVANANGKNRLAIIVPCHRIIAQDGTLGGYSGGLDKKQFLLEHEARC